MEQFRADGDEPEGSDARIPTPGSRSGRRRSRKRARSTKAVAAALRANEFDTVLGTIGFDDKGDVHGDEPFVWYVWQQGDYAPLDPAELTD